MNWTNKQQIINNINRAINFYKQYDNEVAKSAIYQCKLAIKQLWNGN